MQKMDSQKAVVDQMVSSYAGLVKNIDGASDSTKRALLDTVNTSSDVPYCWLISREWGKVYICIYIHPLRDYIGGYRINSEVLLQKLDATQQDMVT